MALRPGVVLSRSDLDVSSVKTFGAGESGLVGCVSFVGSLVREEATAMASFLGPQSRGAWAKAALQQTNVKTDTIKGHLSHCRLGRCQQLLQLFLLCCTVEQVSLVLWSPPAVVPCPLERASQSTAGFLSNCYNARASSCGTRPHARL